MCMFGGQQQAAGTPPPPPPPPADPVTPVDPEVGKARTDAKNRAAAAAGASSTDVTKGALVTPASTSAKQLTGN